MTVSAGAILWVLLVVGWYLIRYPFERRAKRARTERSARDTAEWVRMSISAAGLGAVPLFWLATGWPSAANYQPHLLQTALGAVAAATALVLFRKTHVALGKFWSVSLDIRDGHRLITEGIYGRLRHPMYSAFWLMALAQALLLPNWLCGLSGLAGFGFLFFSRIGPEEKMLEQTFGADYIRYRSRTNRIIPGLW